MKKFWKNMSMLCALSLPLFLGSCAQKAENNQQCENEVKTGKFAVTFDFANTR